MPSNLSNLSILPISMLSTSSLESVCRLKTTSEDTMLQQVETCPVMQLSEVRQSSVSASSIEGGDDRL